MKKNDIYQEIIARSIYKLKLHRELNGLNQNQMAELLGLSSRTYQRIEALETHLDYPSIIRICEILKLDINYFIAKETPNLPEFINPNVQDIHFDLLDEEKEIIEKFKGLNSPSDVLQFLNDEQFKTHRQPLFVSMNTKKYANLKSCSIFGQEKSSKITQGSHDPKIVINYLDYIFTTKPKFSYVGKISYEAKNKKNYISRNIHKYFGNDVVVFSLLKEVSTASL